MYGKSTILNVLREFARIHENVTWEIKCSYCDGMGTTINEIKIYAHPGDRMIGTISYRVETEKVLYCSYKSLAKLESENILDMLLDMMNYSKNETLL